MTTDQAAATSPPRGRQLLRALAALALAALAVAVMLRLSLWQWHRAVQRGSLLNYSYSVEWLIFAGLTLWGLVALHRDGRRSSPRVQPAPRRVQGPMIGPPEADDDVELTYVRLLRRLGLRQDASPAQVGSPPQQR